MRLMRSATFSIAMALLVLAFSGSATADVVAYAATAQGNFGEIDLTTGATSLIGSSNLPAGTSIYGMGLLGNTLYGVDNNSMGAGFYTIDTQSGVANEINMLPVTAYGGTTGFGVFFGVSQDSPSLLFVTDTSGNVLGDLPLGFTGDGLVAFDPGDQNLYFSASTGGGNDELFALNTSTLALSDVGPLGAEAFAGVIVGSTLYTTDGNIIYTYTVSPTSVSGILSETPISGPLVANGDQITALATVPEPTSAILASLGILAAGLVKARRRGGV